MSSEAIDVNAEAARQEAEAGEEKFYTTDEAVSKLSSLHEDKNRIGRGPQADSTAVEVGQEAIQEEIDKVIKKTPELEAVMTGDAVDEYTKDQVVQALRKEVAELSMRDDNLDTQAAKEVLEGLLHDAEGIETIDISAEVEDMRDVSVDDLPEYFTDINNRLEDGIITPQIARESKRQVLDDLHRTTGWDVLGQGSAELHELLTSSDMSADAVGDYLKSVEELYERIAEDSARGLFEEAEMLESTGAKTAAEVQADKLSIIEDIELSRGFGTAQGFDLSGAKELLRAGDLDFESFEAILAEQESKFEAEGHKREIEAARAEKGVHFSPTYLMEAEKEVLIDDMMQRAEEEGWADDRDKVIGERKKLDAFYETVSDDEIPALVTAGDISLERAEEVLANLETHNAQLESAIAGKIESALAAREDELRGKVYRLMDQLQEGGRLDFSGTDLMNTKEEINQALKGVGDAMQEIRRVADEAVQEDLAAVRGYGTVGRIANFIKLRMLGGEKRREADQQESQAGLDRAKENLQALYEQRRQMEVKFLEALPDGVLQSGDIELMSERGILEAGTSGSARESRGAAVPGPVQEVMKDFMDGKLDYPAAIGKVKEAREAIERRSMAVAEQEFDMTEVDSSRQVVDTLHEAGHLSFNGDDLLETLSLTRSDVPEVATQARQTLLQMEGEVPAALAKAGQGDLVEQFDRLREVSAQEDIDNIKQIQTNLDALQRAGVTTSGGREFAQVLAAAHSSDAATSESARAALREFDRKLGEYKRQQPAEEPPPVPSDAEDEILELEPKDLEDDFGAEKETEIDDDSDIIEERSAEEEAWDRVERNEEMDMIADGIDELEEAGLVDFRGADFLQTMADSRNKVEGAQQKLAEMGDKIKEARRESREQRAQSARELFKYIEANDLDDGHNITEQNLNRVLDYIGSGNPKRVDMGVNNLKIMGKMVDKVRDGSSDPQLQELYTKWSEEGKMGNIT